MLYEAPWWLPGGNAQTIWAAVGARRGPGTPVSWRREHWDTPDGDFIDVDFARDNGPPLNRAEQPLLVVFHGLEGSSASHYAQTFAATAAQRGWACAVPHFRGCGGALNRAPRAYHSGDYEEIGWMLQRLRQHHGKGPMLAVGVSLGGNALLRWAQEAGGLAALQVRAIAAVSAPLDLAAGAKAIDTGFNRRVYTRMFLSTMKPKALAKLAQHPGLFDGDALRAARSIHAFDDAFTAPLHGFRDAVDYWSSCSAGPRMDALKLPALVLNALNDPFVPAASLPQVGADGTAGRGESPSKVGAATYWRPATGGHVGFPAGAFPPGNVRAMPQAVCDWLEPHLH
jgi:predicted alpha/beta-fold hydrolase